MIFFNFFIFFKFWNVPLGSFLWNLPFEIFTFESSLWNSLWNSQGIDPKGKLLKGIFQNEEIHSSQARRMGDYDEAAFKKSEVIVIQPGDSSKLITTLTPGLFCRLQYHSVDGQGWPSWPVPLLPIRCNSLPSANAAVPCAQEPLPRGQRAAQGFGRSPRPV